MSKTIDFKSVQENNKIVTIPSELINKLVNVIIDDIATGSWVGAYDKAEPYFFYNNNGNVALNLNGRGRDSIINELVGNMFNSFPDIRYQYGGFSEQFSDKIWTKVRANVRFKKLKEDFKLTNLNEFVDNIEAQIASIKEKRNREFRDYNARIKNLKAKLD